MVLGHVALEWPSIQKALCSKVSPLSVIKWTTISLFHYPLRPFKGYDTFKVSIAMKVTVHFSNITYYSCFMLFDSKVTIMPTTQRAGWFASNTLEHSFSSARQTAYLVRGLLLANLAKKSVHCRRGPGP